MGTVADKLAYLNDTKSAIRTAIGSDSITDDTPFRSYADIITDKLNNVVYQMVIGSSLAITDAINAKFDSIKIFGKSTQEGTPTSANPVEIVSLDTSAATFTINDTALTLPDVGEFRGVPVASGGVYTDSNGQQWICDYVDVLQKRYVQNINSVKVADIPVITRAEFPSGLYRFNMFYSNSNPTLLPALSTAKGQMCNALAISVSPLGGNATDGVIVAYTNGGFFARYDAATTSDEFRTYAATVDLTVNYALKTPIVTPLTDEQVEAFMQLYTSTDGTCISNSMGADMQVIYLKR